MIKDAPIQEDHTAPEQDGLMACHECDLLHRIVPGGADKSYGVHVAKLAGVPGPVIARSREILDELQRGFERESRTPQLSAQRTRGGDQLMLFNQTGEELLDELRSVDPERTTPMDALKLLEEWKRNGGK